MRIVHTAMVQNHQVTSSQRVQDPKTDASGKLHAEIAYWMPIMHAGNQHMQQSVRRRPQARTRHADHALNGGSRLLHNDLADHAGTLVGLAVVAVAASGGELGGELLAGGVEQVVSADGVSAHAGLQKPGAQQRRSDQLSILGIQDPDGDKHVCMLQESQREVLACPPAHHRLQEWSSATSLSGKSTTV